MFDENGSWGCYHFAPNRMAIIIIIIVRKISVGKDVEKSEPSYIAGGRVKWCSLLESRWVGPQKSKHRIPTTL